MVGRDEALPLGDELREPVPGCSAKRKLSCTSAVVPKSRAIFRSSGKSAEYTRSSAPGCPRSTLQQLGEGDLFVHHGPVPASGAAPGTKSVTVQPSPSSPQSEYTERG